MRLMSPLVWFLSLANLASLTPSPALQAQVVPSSHSANGPIDEAGYVSIGGIEQWVTIKGNHRANPVILFVHGGPGNPMSLYSDVHYRDWLDDFTVVHWDQRYAGKTYERNEPTGELTIERFNQAELTTDLLVRDGIDISEYLLRHLDKPKLILTGTSWGSVLGVHMAKKRPELFHAYVGLSQFVAEQRNMKASYDKTLARARAKSDADAVKLLEELGPPPWENPRHFGRMRRIIRRYEGEVTSRHPDLTPGPGYDNDAYGAAYAAGEELSFLKFVGLKHDGMAAQVDLPGLGTDFVIPIILLQGAEDLLTTPEVTKLYFDGITAPEKHYILVPQAGHDPNLAMLKAQRDAIVEYVSPLVER